MMKKRKLGFTLVEMMVAIGIAAILLALAVPSFTPTIKRNRVQSQAREILTALTSARSEAVSRGARITICHLNAASICDGLWSGGATTFIDQGVIGSLDGADTPLHQYSGTGSNTLKVYHYAGVVRTTDQQISFTNTGEVINAGGTASAESFVVCDQDNDATFARAILISPVGQVISAQAQIGAISNDVAGNALICP